MIWLDGPKHATITGGRDKIFLVFSEGVGVFLSNNIDFGIVSLKTKKITPS